MKMIIVIFLFTLSTSSIIETSQPCTCNQLSQNDCSNNKECTWNQNCNTKQITTQVIPIYCSYLNVEQCSQDNACQWVNSSCTFFTGCQAYRLTSDKDCRNLNKRCYKTDLTKCIEKSDCTTYKDEIVCFMDSANKYCYWDSDKQLCSVATTCKQLPSLLDTDDKCRQQISTCTTQPGGGCIESSSNCGDIKLEIQCFQNKTQSQKCFWDNSLNPPLCKIKSCDNASTYFVTDDDCKTYLPECTTKLGGGCVRRSTCEAVTTKSACTFSSTGVECFWVDGYCKQKLCQNATKQIVTNIGCQSINQKCITKAGGGCMQNGECAIANVDYACKLNIRGEYCYWDIISQSCKDRTCVNAPSNLSTHEQCSKFLSTCTVNDQKTGCQDRTCENAPVYITTLQACQEYYNNTCIVKKDGGCITLNLCEDILIEISCLIDKDGNKCFWYHDKCAQLKCLNAPKQEYNKDLDAWIDVKLNHNYCNQFMNTCTISKLGDTCVDYYCNYVSDYDICLDNKQCYWRTSCYTKTCFNAPLSYNTHQLCNNYKNDCTISQKGYGCDIIMATCNLYTNQIQCQYSVANQCDWYNGGCVQKTCQTAKLSINYQQGCMNYMDGCVLNNNRQGCMNKIKQCSDSYIQDNCTLETCHWENNQCVNNQCSSYTTDCINRLTPVKCINNSNQSQCIDVPNNCNDLPNEYCIPSQSINLIGIYCIINNGSCIDFVLQTNCNIYNSQDKCITKSSSLGLCVYYNSICYNDDCTQLPITKTNTAQCQQIISRCILSNTGQGCREKGECTDYNSYNCDQQDKHNNQCALKNGTCQIKSCITGTYTTHDQCYSYIIDPNGIKCTVNQNLNGCMELSSCLSYKIKEQCYKDFSQNDCIWQGNTCLDKICTNNVTAQNHIECQNYKNTCTFNTVAGIGCTDFPSSCTQITDSAVCLSNQQCIISSGKCIDRTCENAILDTYDEPNCSSLPFSNCSYLENYCSTKSCQYYKYTTDVECLQQDSTCTTNGVICTERLYCKDAVVEDACYIDRYGTKCQWISSQNKCVNRTCSTAPTTLTTEQQCSLYYTGCTTKSGGGCVIKSTCQNADTQAACNSSITGDICQWDDSTRSCRLQKCKDFNGNDYKVCNKQRSNCTTNGANKCTEIIECKSYTNALSCIVGVDGPCLWINNKCQQYTDCTSLKSSSHQTCQNLSKNCTTNGTTCVSISECNENNVNGCFIGIDGECILTLSSTNSKVCTTFSKCSAAKFQTHQDCNNANVKCTTDKTQCIELLQCKDYKFQEQCYLDLNSIQYSDNKIKSTGACQWDTQSSTCRLQICTDLIGSTHQMCNEQLMGCTTNGTTCITQQSCQNYTKVESCNNGQGTDGKCVFLTDTQKCRIMTCTDITNNQCSMVDNCISDGTKCLQKSKCSTYLTKMACDSSGTDGQCSWDSTKSKCSLFSSCSVATDISYCSKLNTICYWNSDILKCLDLTCEIQYQQKNVCQYIDTWTSNQIKTCGLTNGQCAEIDPSNYLIDNCYQSTKYTYTFSSATQKCIKCSSINNQTNNTQNSSNQSADSYQTLLFYLIIQLFLFLN